MVIRGLWTDFRTYKIRPRLPKKAERFVFFRITNEQEFKKGLPVMADFLTTAHAASENRNDIYRKKAEGTLKGIVRLVSINISFSATGLTKVSTGKMGMQEMQLLIPSSWGRKSSTTMSSTVASLKT